MIAATEADIGRRVIYRTPFQKCGGTVREIEGRCVMVEFDGDDWTPEIRTLRVFSNLEWADGRRDGSETAEGIETP